MRFRPTPLMAAASALVMASGAQGLGFGRIPGSAPLGSPLDFPIPIRLESDETLTADCINAEVLHGEQRLGGRSLQVLIEPGPSPQERVIRLVSPVAMNEPVIVISLGLGCPQRVSRRFTAFVDPPALALPPMAAASAAPTVAQSAAVGAGEPMATSPLSPSGVTPGAPPAAAKAGRGASVAGSVPRPRRARAAAADTATAAAAEAPPARRRPLAVVAAAPSARKSPPPAPVAAVPRLPAGISRLRLEEEEPEFFPAASGASAPGGRPLLPFLADTAAAVEMAASSSERVKALEKSLEQLRAESKSNRELLTQMRSQIATAETTNRLAPWLGAGLAVMAALAIWLGLRLRKAQREPQAQWWASGSPPETAVPTGADAASAPGLVPEARPVTTMSTSQTLVNAAPAPAPAPAPAMPAMAVVEPEPDEPAAGIFDTAVVRGDGPAADPAPESPPQRAVAIEELLDLEQQAEFFLVLGQEDAAVELLMGHIRNSGGSSPLPYLKLLEIFQRSGDRDSYERTRTRFNHRFNAYAPEWEVDIRSGRALEDYPDVLRRLQQLWTEPIDAMAELEAMMFRRDDAALFELPAYRELLFLYSLVRDVFDHLDDRPESVDVLLPLGRAEEAADATPTFVLENTPSRVVDTDFDPPAVSIDLDLDAIPPAPQTPAAPPAAAPGAPAGRLRNDDGDFGFTLSPPGNSEGRR